MPGYKKLTAKIRYAGMDRPDVTRHFIITVPESVSGGDVSRELTKMYHHLKKDPSQFNAHARMPENLVNIVCLQQNWHYERIQFEVDLDLPM